MAKQTTRSSIFNLTATAMLLALTVVFSFFQVPVGPLRLTLAPLPVAIGGVILGANAGLFLGAAFGVCSFLTCLGMDAFGVFLFNTNPWLALIVCLVPRMLCGWLPALLYRWLGQKDPKHLWAPALCSALVAILNTVLFLGTMWLLFGGTFTTTTSDFHFESIGALITAAVTINAPVDLLINLLLGGAIAKAVFAMRRRMHF